MVGKYAIETVDLVKRYPTSARPDDGGGWHGRVNSFANILGALRGTRGPFVEALRGLSLQVNRGEVFGLLGPNGAGKTTLIKILCTLVIHDAGQVLVNGTDVKREPGKVLRNLQAVLPESRGFSWRLSGRQNLDFYALLYGLKKDEARARIDYLLEITALKDRADDSYQRFSTGMQRKLLLCRALIRDTPVLVFDEPTAGLDPASGADFRRLLRDRLAREEGKTVFLSTHNLDEAQEICDRVAIIDRGRLVACDAPRNLRYMLTEVKVFQISFAAPVSDGWQEWLDGVAGIPGVRSAEPELDGTGRLIGTTVRADKTLALSAILAVLMGKDVDIASVNTVEPTLEDVFTTVTRRDRRAPRR